MSFSCEQNTFLKYILIMFIVRILEKMHEIYSQEITGKNCVLHV